jgi:hypothetical protein
MYEIKIIVALLLASIPVGYGSSLLQAKVDSAYCTGNLTLNLISASCEDEESCTFGSEVYLYGQGERIICCVHASLTYNITPQLTLVRMDATPVPI